MNLTPKSWKKSEVEEQKNRVVVGTKLIYCDYCNFQRFTVTAVDGNIASLVDSDGWEDSVNLDGLQLGWEFA
jgi:hypothetical protein